MKLVFRDSPAHKRPVCRFAPTVVELVPEWGIVLPDLRAHGGSRDLAPPHTVASAAADLIALGPTLPGPIDAVIGHSFGGKVALEYLRLRDGALRCAVTLDASPSARGREAWDTLSWPVIEWLGTLPSRFESREAFVEVATAAGFHRGMGEWLAMNLERDGDGMRVGLDLAVIRALIEDYMALDQWSLVEDPPGGARIVLAIAARSVVYTEEDRARAALLARSGARVSYAMLTAGHWVHVDDPEGVVGVIAGALR